MAKSIHTKISILLAVLLLAVVVLGVLPSTAFADTEEQYIKLEYLQRIEGTPFAHKVQALIKVPVYENHTLKLNDVKKALNCKQFGVMQSYCDTFKYDSKTNTYKAVYYKSVYLEAKTVDGNSFHYYLDCNWSFKSFFHAFVNAGFIDEGLYEVFYNYLHFTYGELDGYELDDIYGYWGFVTIPDGNDLNQLWKDMFNTETTFSGVVKSFSFSSNLTLTQYNYLLDDYQYRFLEIVWKDFVGLLQGGNYKANNYILYCDSGTIEAYVAENGADDLHDDHSVIYNSIENAYEKVRDTIREYFDDTQNVTMIITLVGGILLLVIVIALISKLFKSDKKK